VAHLRDGCHDGDPADVGASLTAAIRAFDASAFAPESMSVIGSETYLHLPDGMGRSKLAIAVNRRPEVAAGTARNWNTVRKLADLAAD
jgi:uncharacterized protein (DUF1697 family)